MKTQLQLVKPSSQQLYLDPRTKILLCITVSTIMIAGNGEGYLRYLQLCLAVLPLICFLILKKRILAIKYTAMYLFAALVPELLLPYLPSIINVLFTGIIAAGTKLLPGMSMAYFLISSTSVSEFIAAMDRMHISKKLSIPISVMFRFFPTIRQEYAAIRDAMRLREVYSVRNPMAMMEYRLVPLLMSVVSIGNDLSAAALTRGLNAPFKRTNVCAIGFSWKDVIVIIFTISCIVIFSYYEFMR